MFSANSFSEAVSQVENLPKETSPVSPPHRSRSIFLFFDGAVKQLDHRAKKDMSRSLCAKFISATSAGRNALRHNSGCDYKPNSSS